MRREENVLSSVKRKKERKRRAEPTQERLPDTHARILIVWISLELSVIGIRIIEREREEEGNRGEGVGVGYDN